MEGYKKQVELLLQILPEVSTERCFALHGGTAINLFVRDLPRLSVDIDLTYIPFEKRELSLKNIMLALARLKSRLENVIPSINIIHQKEVLKLQISKRNAQVKIEVNQVDRGLFGELRKMQLCKKAQIEYDAFCEVSIVSLGQLYGGKICAALDRQHPRDLFDVRSLMQNEGFTADIKTGLILNILGSKRPIHELLFPHLLDQRLALSNQFDGMSNEEFNYSDFEKTREDLIKVVHANFTEKDIAFILSFKKTQPDWEVYNFKKFPAVQWKLRNLIQLKTSNPLKHLEQLNLLKKKLLF